MGNLFLRSLISCATWFVNRVSFSILKSFMNCPVLDSTYMGLFLSKAVNCYQPRSGGWSLQICSIFRAARVRQPNEIFHWAFLIWMFGSSSIVGAYCRRIDETFYTFGLQLLTNFLTICTKLDVFDVEMKILSSVAVWNCAHLTLSLNVFPTPIWVAHENDILYSKRRK